jgi:elongation factor G
VLSAKDGVQPITERVYGWIREQRLPCIAVVTKVDVENATPEEAVHELKQRLRVPVAVMEIHLGEGSSFQGVATLRTKQAWVGKGEGPGAAGAAIPAAFVADVEQGRARLVDDVAGTDDDLTERYLTEGDLTQEELDRGLREATRTAKVVPVLFASGVRPAGIAALLDAIVELVPAPLSHGPWVGTIPGKGLAAERAATSDAHAAAFVFKTSIDQHAGRTSFARVLSGSLKPDHTMLNASTGHSERLGKISSLLGKEAKVIEEAVAGDIVALGKLKATLSGQTLSDEKHPFLFSAPELPPALFARGVRFEGKGSEEKVGTALHRLHEEDPGLHITHDESTRELVVSGLGSLHLEITVERIKRRTGVEVHLGPPHIPYKETISKKITGIEGKHKKQSGGHGQFGVCFIDMEPNPRGAGFTFDDAVVGGSIPRQFIPSVEKGIVKAMERGILAGFPVVDLKVRVFDGKYHDVDSSDAAFQIAGRKAFKEAVAKAGPVILEPVMKLQVTVPSENMGDVIGDLNSRRGRVVGTDTGDGYTLINAFVPLAEVLEYESKLKSMTQGKGTFTMATDPPRGVSADGAGQGDQGRGLPGRRGRRRVASPSTPETQNG